MHVHLDGDLLVYRCGFAAEKQQWNVVDPEWDDVIATATTKREAMKFAESCTQEVRVEKGQRIAEPVENALHNVRLMVKDILENLGINEDEFTMYLSGKTNFRTGIATIKEYKGNRDPDHKPVHGPAIKEFMEKHYPVKYSEDEEADDLVGYSHYAMYLRDPHSSVIATVDKDLDMIPGMHYNFIKDESYFVTEAYADRWFYTQLIMGDSTDNIPGIPGYGPAKAAKVMRNLKDPLKMYARVKKLYEEHYPENPVGALIENARLLWIRRQPNEWWQPPIEEDMDDQ